MYRFLSFTICLMCLSLITASGQETVFEVVQNSWDPSGVWSISAKTEQSMYHERWYFFPDNTFFVMVRGDRNNLPESYGVWEQTGSDFIMKYEQFRSRSYSASPLTHHFRIERLSNNTVSLTGLNLDLSLFHPLAVNLIRQ